MFLNHKAVNYAGNTKKNISKQHNYQNIVLK